MAKKKVIVSVSNDLYTDNRVNKICMFLCDQGYEVLLVGRKRKNSQELAPRRYITKRMKLLFDKGPLFYAALNFRLFFFLLFRKSDILVSNDLDTLLANYWASKFKRKVKLVYDSHEFFTEAPELIHRPKVRNIWLKIERRIFPKLEYAYTVNQSIADQYYKRYGKELGVVRNIGPKWNPAKLMSRKELGLPENKFIVIIQGSGINVDRGAEEAVEAMKQLKNVLLIFVGDGDVIPQLKKNVAEQQLEEKVQFFGKRPYDELMQFTHAADVGLSLDKPLSPNYIYSLPNKIFDYIMAETPIICTDLVEVTGVISSLEVGLVLNEFNPEQLVNAISELQNDSDRLKLYRENCKKAAEHTNWEVESKQLEWYYPKV